MGANAEMDVDMRLQLKKLREDVARAAKVIKDGLSNVIHVKFDTGGVDKASAGARKIKSEMEGAAKAAKQVSAESAKVVDATKGRLSGGAASAFARKTAAIFQEKLNQSRGRYGLATEVPEELKEAISNRPMSGLRRKLTLKQFQSPAVPDFMNRKHFANIPQSDKAAFWREMSMGLTMIGRPTSPWAAAFTGRQTFEAFNTRTGQSMLQKMGMAGGVGGAAAATGIVLAGLAAVGLALAGFKKSLDEARAAAERARNMYARALSQGGLALGFSIRRHALADIVGVSDEDIVKFGRVIEALNPRIENATEIFAKTTPKLTAMAWELRIVKMDVEAFWATLATKMEPVIMKFLNSIDSIVKGLTSAVEHIGGIINKHPGLFKGFVTGVLAGAENALGAPGMITPIAIGGNQKPLNEAPNVFSMMRQLRSGAMEHMGLIVGNNGNTALDYAHRTAVATEQTAKALAGGRLGRGIPSAPPLGFYPGVANP